LAERSLDELPDGDRVRVDVPGDLPPLRTDAAQVQRALVNVLENALKFSPSGSAVTLRADRRGGEIVLRVEDHGPGVAVDEMAKVFEPFHHARGGGGSGLGLAIARGFVTANGGRIWVEAAPSGGASFVITLPVADLSPVPA
jgi:two-component system sensor histidine kinase KdpD